MAEMVDEFKKREKPMEGALLPERREVVLRKLGLDGKREGTGQGKEEG